MGQHRTPLPAWRRSAWATEVLSPIGDRQRRPLPGQGRLHLADVAPRPAPWKTFSYYFYTWRDAGIWEKVHSALRDEIRAAAGKQSTPSLAIIDSKPVKTTEAGGPKGYVGGKKIGGRNRHILVDTLGLIWGLAVLAARPTDWDGAVEVFRRLGRRMTLLTKVLGDHAYRALALAAWIKEHCRWQLETSGRRVGQTRFEPVKWRWIVERTFGWFGRYRRMSKDDEHNPASSEAWI